MNSALKPVFWVVVAVIAGILLGQVAASVAIALSPLSKLIIQLIKMAATPLVLFAVIEAVLRHQIAGRDFLKLLTLVMINALIAIGIGLAIANAFQPGQYLQFLQDAQAEPLKLAQTDLLSALFKQVPSSVVQPFTDNDILGTVILALLFAFAFRSVRQKHLDDHLSFLRIENGIAYAREIAETVLVWIVKLVPLAIFAAAANLTAKHGLSPFEGLGKYVALCILGMSIHVLFVYSAWLVLIAKIGFIRFWKHAAQPVLYAFGVNSSLVALPLTLRALDQLGISRRAATLTACIGTNLNNDGIILYEGFTLLALAQAFGIDLSLSAQIVAGLYCVVAAMGVAGVPEAGVVALTLVLSAFGIPVEALAVLLSVDWIIARWRSLLNVSSDMVGATVLEKWLDKRRAS